MNTDKLIQDLKIAEDIIPDLYDGSYELVRQIISSYATVGDLDRVTFADLNAVYLMAVGTWRINSQNKKEKINETCLPDDEKNRLIAVIDKVWDNACRKKYQHNADPKKPSVGMFGTGFMSFFGKTTDECAKQFIGLCVNIQKISDERFEEIYDISERVLNGGFKGMKAASASIILHCLRPTIFPVMNGNMGNDNIYVALGINVVRPAELSTYIENCRRILAFRNEEFPFKNYRVLDLKARELKEYQDTFFFPSLEEYNPSITTEQYITLLQDESVVKKNMLDTIYYLYAYGGEASCKQLAYKFGNKAAHYNANAIATAKAIQKATGCKMYNRESGENRYWTILFQGRDASGDEDGRYVYRMRSELWDAIAALDDEDFFEEFKMKKAEKFDNNIILYGPPGTGKTYNSAIYAVAICDGLSYDEVKSWSYEKDVLPRYNQLKTEGRIAFTTFHQSYGYEEFIEGIRPVLAEDSDHISYEIADGCFKAFCDNALCGSIKRDGLQLPLNDNPTVWKVSLALPEDNEVRTECFQRGHIRIGMDEYGPVLSEKTEYLAGGKVVLGAFYDKMKVGDIVVSSYTSEVIDAIGIITGEPEWIEEYDYYKRVRKVNWLVTGIRENIVKANDNKPMVSVLIHKLDISVRDIIETASKYLNHSYTEDLSQNYVFIIDEINRGNISKIFGELITLIEGSKRIGESEEMRAMLPYSKKMFGVPKNVYILGTMNTADRSIALMDTALRRRFSFIEMMPDSSVLKNIHVMAGGKVLNISNLLDVINRRIEWLYDREHTIGHAFFWPLSKNPSMNCLGDIFRKSVIPLLQEYFYEDYSKIRLVLGDNGKKEDELITFVLEDTFEKGIFRVGGNDDLPDDEAKYVVNPKALYNIDSYKAISESL